MRYIYITLVMMLLVVPAWAQHDKPNTTTTATSTSESRVSAPATATQSIVDQSVNPRQAPSVWPPEASTTSSCRNGYSGGGSFLTGGAVIGFTRTDKECEKRAAADAFSKLGHNEDAFLLLCELKVARHLNDCKPKRIERK
jgi:hypothetical protein